MGKRALVPRKRFEDMSVSELQDSLHRLETSLKWVEGQISRQRAEAKALGKTISALDYPDLETKRANFSWMIRQVEPLLKKYKLVPRPAPANLMEAENFQKVAKIVLEAGLYNDILAQARDL